MRAVLACAALAACLACGSNPSTPTSATPTPATAPSPAPAPAPTVIDLSGTWTGRLEWKDFFFTPPERQVAVRAFAVQRPDLTLSITLDTSTGELAGTVRGRLTSAAADGVFVAGTMTIDAISSNATIRCLGDSGEQASGTFSERTMRITVAQIPFRPCDSTLREVTLSLTR